MTPTIAELDSSIIERLNVPADSAQGILSIEFSNTDEARMQDLIDRNNQGTLSDAEKHEMESFRRVGRFLAIVQARARLQLKQNGSQTSE